MFNRNHLQTLMQIFFMDDVNDKVKSLNGAFLRERRLAWFKEPVCGTENQSRFTNVARRS